MNFNQAIQALNELRAKGQKNTPRYRELLELATKLNPSATPVGFYLD